MKYVVKNITLTFYNKCHFVRKKLLINCCQELILKVIKELSSLFFIPRQKKILSHKKTFFPNLLSTYLCSHLTSRSIHKVFFPSLKTFRMKSNRISMCLAQWWKTRCSTILIIHIKPNWVLYFTNTSAWKCSNINTFFKSFWSCTPPRLMIDA